MTEDLTDVQRAVLFKLARNAAATVTEIHEWWFKHLSRSTVKTAVDWLVFHGMARVAGVGDHNARTFTATDEGCAATGRDWTITADPDGAAIATGPATVRFTKQDGRITPYEIIQWLHRNRDIARSGGTVDLTTGTFRTDAGETP